MHTLKISPRLLALLRLAKTQNSEYTKEAVIEALGDLYCHKMTLPDVIHHLVEAYQEVILEPRFKATSKDRAVENLLLAPIKGFHSVDFFGPKSPSTTYSIDQFYGAMIRHILGQLSITTVDWCANQLWEQSQTEV